MKNTITNQDITIINKPTEWYAPKIMTEIYQPLHHKYRPDCFDALVGQEAIVSTLKQALITKRIAPAYIFSGPRGTGKTSSARILARYLNKFSRKLS